MHWVDAVGNSPGVRLELIDGIGSLPGWHKGVRQKKTETRRKIVGCSRKACRELTMIGAMKLQPDDGPRLSLSIGPGLGQCSGISPNGIRKFAENTSGDRRKKTG
ncbi:hypothetical protein B296_00028540 [Ensete ventricosum]|uniref:Uncharacterized protein n=1 Tax=Ensete ventricosum TaxID=4639 RepID=A0A426Y7Z4_ENSVE|nr:hypothetical protein B296_00028540 [Ensete ventricosum]